MSIIEARPKKLGEEVHPHDHTVDRDTITVLDQGFVRYVDSMGDDFSIVQAARVSYGKGTKAVNEDKGLIRYLMRHRHTTPFEMVQFKFHIKAPIFVFRQWHRHRMWSYNEYSGRYSEMKDEFYVPENDLVTKQNPNNKQGGIDEKVPFVASTISDSWEQTFSNEQKEARKHYESYLNSGMRKELARINLPLAQYSEMYASVNLHNLFHFLKLRLDSHAQYEIRVYAEAIAEIVQNKVPWAYEAFEDYYIKSWTLSFGEQAAISEVFDIVKNSLTSDNESWEKPHHLPRLIQEAADRHFSNKRENKECVEKLSKLLLYHGPDYKG